jgi:hypothetical protein
MGLRKINNSDDRRALPAQGAIPASDAAMMSKGGIISELAQFTQDAG